MFWKKKTWDEHLEWCKRRALAYVDKGDLCAAAESMLSDMMKHPGSLNNSPVRDVLVKYLPIAVMMGDSEEVRRCIKGIEDPAEADRIFKLWPRG